MGIPPGLRGMRRSGPNPGPPGGLDSKTLAALCVFGQHVAIVHSAPNASSVPDLSDSVLGQRCDVDDAGQATLHQTRECNECVRNCWSGPILDGTSFSPQSHLEVIDSAVVVVVSFTAGRTFADGSFARAARDRNSGAVSRDRIDINVGEIQATFGFTRLEDLGNFRQ